MGRSGIRIGGGERVEAWLRVVLEQWPMVDKKSRN